MIKKYYRTIRLAPLIIFLVFVALTVEVWREQVEHQRSLLESRSQDVGMQASRRLEIFIEFHMTIARIFADRWSSHEGHDFSRKRYEEFASVLLSGVAGFHSLILVPPDGGAPWVVPENVDTSEIVGHIEWERTVGAATDTGRVALSAPIELETGRVVFFAVLPMFHDGEFIGHFVVEFQATTLINECFHHRIRSEFGFEVTDSDQPLFSFTQDDDGSWFEQSTIRAFRDFPVQNRKWRLTVVPRQELVRDVGWKSSLSVPLLGILLSAALALLVHVLLGRMNLYRAARDKALSEIAERRKAESELDASRARYRSVFESATDGMIILDQGGRIIEANAAACTMHGYDPGEIVGKFIRELIAPAHQYVYERFKRELEQNGTVRLDSVDVCKDESTFDVEVRGTDFRFGGKPRVLAILTDVSAHKHAEERLALLSRKVLLAQEEERQRLSRDLHDELGQLLTAQRLELDWLEKRMKPMAGESPEGFENAVNLVEDATRELRRICQGLRPPLLDDLGIEPAVSLLVEEFEQRTGIRVDLDIQMQGGPENVPQENALCAYRVLQESLTNISRHSDALRVDISLECGSSELMLSVYDDGRGFRMSDEQSARGSGITGMHERAHLVGGTIEIRSAPSQGTRVVFRAPLEVEKQ